jgi:hypothetical protein
VISRLASGGDLLYKSRVTTPRAKTDGEDPPQGRGSIALCMVPEVGRSEIREITATIAWSTGFHPVDSKD